jgi:hypothetical protein
MPNPSGRDVQDMRASATRTVTALVLGWLVPGAGHAVLGRLGRAGLFFAIVMGSFGLGLAHDGKLALYTDQDRVLTALQVVANAGIGPVDAIARSQVYGDVTYCRPETTDPRYKRIVDTWRARQRSLVSIYGTAYLWTAGLMNILLLFDVWDIAVGRKG